MKNIAIYGGTFDPPHLGHLNTAEAIQHQFHFDRFVFLPCKVPILKKEALATPEQRIEMLTLALIDYPEFSIDTREIARNTPSYMVDTLISFRQEYGEHIAITLCLGIDTFIQLPKWHSWQDIIKLSNLLVMKRATIEEKELSEPLKHLLLNHETFEQDFLLQNPYGNIYRLDAGQYPISSSELRSQIKAGENVESYLTKKVYQYIRSQALYLSYPAA